jgi:predicted PilT family ATPase
MASEAPTVSGASADNLTPAQRLAEKHDDHKPSIEEVVDEEDIIHPPPSASLTASSSAGPSTAAPTPTPESKPAAAPPKKKAPVFDTQSEELFPSLGASKSRASAGPSPWSKKPAAVGNANGLHNGQVANSAPSRASPYAPGTAAPASSNAAFHGVSLPGRYTEHISFAPSQIAQAKDLKKPLSEILRDLNKRSKAKVEMSQGAGGSYTFRATGPTPNDVREALKEIARQLGSKVSRTSAFVILQSADKKQQSVKVPIPPSVRAHIIGRGGANITALSQKTGAKIQVPRAEENEALDDDDSATIDVLIEGDAVAAEMARQEIEKIVNERTSSTNLRLKDIPAEFYPFLAGVHNSRIGELENGRDLRVQIPHYHTWVDQAPAQAAAYRQPPAFVPQASLPIQIAGDRLAANDARAQLERRVEQLRRELVSDQVAIERGRHQFIVGDRGTSLHDFLAETGCAVILPPDAEDDENLTIVGPADRIDEGLNKVMELASSMAMASVDISRSHPNAPLGAQAHARNVTKYLQQRRAIQDLERLYDARIVANTARNAPTAWEVYSRDGKNTMKARSDIMNLISGHPPARLNPVQVHPFYHQHLRQSAASQIRDQFNVHMVIPDGSDNDHEILLVYEGPTSSSDYQLPRRQPAANEARDFERALKEAQQHLLGLLSGQKDIVDRDIQAPSKFHDKIRRHVDREQSNLPSDQIPVQLLFGGQAARKTPTQGLSVRGPSDRADALVESLLAFIEQEKQDELERGFTLTFDFPQKFANFLIGKKGENIRKLREEFDVEIQVNDGKVELKGPQAKANACKAHILALGKKLEDEATYVIKVKPQFHKDLIGTKGSMVNRLQDRYNVKINFPRSNNAGGDDAADGENSRKSDQGPDEVVIRGPKRGADEAREELLNLLQYTMDNSHTATVSVAQSQLPSLIGAGGRELDNLRLATGAHVDIPNNRDAADASGRVDIKIKGSKKAVEDAKKQIEEAAKVFDSTVTRTLDVEKKHHRNIIGGRGLNLRNIVIQAGGPDDGQKLARMVRFPRAEAEGNTIRVEAHQTIADKIVAAIEAQVSELESQTTQIVEIAPAKHPKLIGRGGDVRKKIESDFDVQLDIPRQNVTGPERSKVKLTGRAENIEKAKEYMETLTKDEESAEIQVPLKFHHAIADNGQFFRRLRNDFRVSVGHKGQQAPKRPEALSTRKAGSGMPLITDDASGGASDDNVSWVVHNLHDNASEGDIVWELTGASAESIQKASARVKKALAEAQNSTHAGFLVLPDPNSYRRVVGRNGETINDIRAKTGTKITVPKAQSGEEAIEITGSQSGIESAKELILVAIQG